MGIETEAPQRQEKTLIKRGPFQDVAHYMIWWTIWGAVLSGLQVVDTTSHEFWPMKGLQITWGLAIGATCGILFTVGQNAINKERGKTKAWVLAVAIWIVVGFGATALMRAAQEQAMKTASVAVERQMEKTRADAVKAHPDLPVVQAIQKESAKQITEALEANSTSPEQMAITAADQFWGFFFLNTKSRPELCSEQGVDISSFTKTFETLHRAEVDRATAIYARQRITSDQIYEVSKASLRKFVMEDMQGIATANATSLGGACKILAAAGSDVAHRMHLSKMHPAMEKALMGH